MRIRATFEDKALQRKLKWIAIDQERKNREDVVVGFSMNYAAPVHENLEAYHEVGEAKFLENAFKRLRKDTVRIVSTVYAKTRSLTKGLLVAGLGIQREAQKATPVDTGALKNSAFTAKDSQLREAAEAAEARGQQMRG